MLKYEVSIRSKDIAIRLGTERKFKGFRDTDTLLSSSKISSILLLERRFVIKRTSKFGTQLYVPISSSWNVLGRPSAELRYLSSE